MIPGIVIPATQAQIQTLEKALREGGADIGAFGNLILEIRRTDTVIGRQC
jgi:hypothetical protein